MTLSDDNSLTARIFSNHNYLGVGNTSPPGRGRLDNGRVTRHADVGTRPTYFVFDLRSKTDVTCCFGVYIYS